MKSSSAAGKVILLGEHAVVYGVPALAVGIDRGVRATAVPASGTESVLAVRNWNVVVREGQISEPSGEALIARALAVLLATTRAAQRAQGQPEIPAIEIVAEAEIPPGGGLGSSAALGVAIARILDPDASPAVIAERVGAWEEVFHGNASGVDAAVSARGGCVYFTRGSKPQTVRMGAPLHLAIGNSGVISSTKTMVDGVARLCERKPELAEKTWAGVRSLVRNAHLAVEAGDVSALGKLMDMNQMLLAGLFVSNDEIETLCAIARDRGALGAKLTGAGGGGSVVALVHGPDAAEDVVAAWRARGFEGFSATVRSPSPIAFEEATP